MGLYRMFNPQFWTDPIIEKMTKEQKYMYLYLITNPSASLCGCYELTKNRIAYETGLKSISAVTVSIGYLIGEKLIGYDDNTNEVILYKWPKNNWTSSDKLNKPLYNEINKIKNKNFKDFLALIYNQRDSIDKKIDMVLIGYPYPSDTSQDTSTSTFTSNTEYLNINNKDIVEKEIQEKEIKNPVLSRFKIFWQHYPKKEAKGKCEEWFLKHKPSAELLDTMIAAVEKQKKSKKWLEQDGRFIKMPMTWLNGKCWGDELETAESEAIITGYEHKV